jgi:hypothetical protein
MTSVFSFCKKDFVLARELARHIEAMGGVRKHGVLLIHPDNVDGREIESCLVRCFGRFKSLPYRETLKGWPDGPNQCFAVAARAMMEFSKEPWLWMEADCVPTRPEWLDEIETEHQYCGQPILGVLENTYGPEGEVVWKHPNGVAVYPHDWWKICPILATMESATDSYRLSGNLPPAFDCYQAPYSTPRCSESRTIKNLWKSFGFTEENGRVKCKFQQEYGASSDVDMSAALIHGCKDFSLIDIVQSRLLV